MFWSIVAYPEDSQVSIEPVLIEISQNKNDLGFDLAERGGEVSKVVRLDSNGPAERSGLRVGDTILAVNGNDVSALPPADLLAQLENLTRVRPVVVRIHRSGTQPMLDSLAHW